MTFPDPHFQPKDPMRWQHLAEHLRAHPDGFAIALENLDRWEKWGRTHPAGLREWRSRIINARTSATAMNDFLIWLAADNTDAEPLKSCSPFAGVLPEPAHA